MGSFRSNKRLSGQLQVISGLVGVYRVSNGACVHFRISKSFFKLDMGPAQSGMGPLGLTWTLLGIVNVLMTGLSLLRPCNCPHGWSGPSQAYVSISRPGMGF